MNSILITSKPNLREPLDFAPPAENLQVKCAFFTAQESLFISALACIRYDAPVASLTDSSPVSLAAQRQAVKTQEAALRKPTYTADYTAKPESYSGGSGPFALGKPAQTTALPVAQPVAAARGGEASTLGDSLATTDAGDVGGPAFGSSGCASKPSPGASNHSSSASRSALTCPAPALSPPKAHRRHQASHLPRRRSWRHPAGHVPLENSLGPAPRVPRVLRGREHVPRALPAQASADGARQRHPPAGAQEKALAHAHSKHIQLIRSRCRPLTAVR